MMTAPSILVRTTIRLFEDRGLLRKDLSLRGIQELLRQGYEPEAIVIAYCGQPKEKERRSA